MGDSEWSESDLKCKRKVGCHACALAALEEDLRLFRMAVVQFLIEPSSHISRLKDQALSLKVQIDCWIQPRKDV